MNFKSINIIQEHLVAATISHFQYLEKFWGQDAISQYQEILELVAFLFEDYRGEFIQLMESRYTNKLNRNMQDMEIVIFISWCSQHAFGVLNEHEKEHLPIYSES